MSAYNNGVPRRSPHGDARRGQYAPEWMSWIAMLSRCNRPSQKNYPRYGGRGIKVCQRWAESYLAFLEDMGRMPGPGYTIERRDNGGDYEPDNCRWATKSEQQNNRRNTLFIEHDGKKLALGNWSAISGVSSETISRRIKRGWSVVDAIFLPASKKNPKHYGF